jgi:photosystem II stability/assembly factor-like uncharacterized protein
LKTKSCQIENNKPKRVFIMKRILTAIFVMTMWALLHIQCSNATGPSSDKSSVWKATSTGLPENTTVKAITNVSGTKILYAGTYDGIYKSTNNGDSWTQSNNGLTALDISALAAGKNDLVFAGTWGKGVFKSTNGSATWTSTWKSSQSPHINGVVVAANNNVWAATEHGLYKSVDDGVSWMHMFSYGKIRSVNVHPTDTNIIYIGVRWHGNFRSRDGGATWQEINSGVYSDGQDVASANRFLFHPDDSEKIFMSTGWVDLYYTENGGDSWELTASQLIELSVLGLDIVKNNPQDLWALTEDDGVYFSENGSESWTLSNDGLDGAKVKSLFVTDNSQSTVFVGTLGKGIFRYAEK